VATTEIDAGGAEAFAGRALQILNDGMLTLLLSVGHQTGLLDTMAESGPRSSGSRRFRSRSSAAMARASRTRTGTSTSTFSASTRQVCSGTRIR
jgi:hypothetical protein